MLRAVFFDMDGVLFDSMPAHAAAWEQVMTRHHLHFTRSDCYVNEGRTGADVIYHAIWDEEHREANKDEIDAIYKEKTDAFHSWGESGPMMDIDRVLQVLGERKIERWIVTGSGQQSLFDRLERYFPSVFPRERMITAFDVVHGKPNAEPYLKAWERSGYKKEECVVVENAPLGVRAGKAAGLFTIAVNTGPLQDEVLAKEGADLVLSNMKELAEWIEKTTANSI